MVRAAALSLILLAMPALAQTDSPWLDWVVANSPHGFDITHDGTIWINVSAVGRKDDYAIRAEDLQAARTERPFEPTFWVRGYHKRNPKVSYRESKARMTIHCAREEIATSTTAYYDAEGNLLWQTGPTGYSYIIPGSYGEEYHRLLCLL